MQFCWVSFATTWSRCLIHFIFSFSLSHSTWPFFGFDFKCSSGVEYLVGLRSGAFTRKKERKKKHEIYVTLTLFLYFFLHLGVFNSVFLFQYFLRHWIWNPKQIDCIEKKSIQFERGFWLSKQVCEGIKLKAYHWAEWTSQIDTYIRWKHTNWRCWRDKKEEKKKQQNKKMYNMYTFMYSIRLIKWEKVS